MAPAPDGKRGARPAATTTVGDEESVPEAVSRSVASAGGVRETAMTPLYGTVDTDALEQLLDDMALGHVTFEYEGFWVEAYADGLVHVYDP